MANERRPMRRREPKEFEDVVVSINRVSKTVKGGRRMRFAALVVVGDKKGRVGFGMGKAAEVPDAIKKATEAATKNVFRVKLVEDNRTVPHAAIGNTWRKPGIPRTCCSWYRCYRRWCCPFYPRTGRCQRCSVQGYRQPYIRKRCLCNTGCTEGYAYS